jgi:hypothetical protein
MINVSHTEATHLDDMHCFSMKQLSEEDTHVDVKEVEEEAATTSVIGVSCTGNWTRTVKHRLPFTGCHGKGLNFIPL